MRTYSTINQSIKGASPLQGEKPCVVKSETMWHTYNQFDNQRSDG